jgi:SAM-dependent methyltransferase
VVGVDICEEQVELARGGPAEGGRVEYRVMDAAEVDRARWERPFDLVTACMSLHCMVDPGAALRASRRVLAPRGRVVASVPHPFTHMLGGRQSEREAEDGRLRMTVGGYFDAAAYRVAWDLPRAGASWMTIRYSRSLGDYWRLFTEAGLTVREVLEPRPTADALRECPELAATAEIPYYLVIVAT